MPTSASASATTLPRNTDELSGATSSSTSCLLLVPSRTPLLQLKLGWTRSCIIGFVGERSVSRKRSAMCSCAERRVLSVCERVSQICTQGQPGILFCTSKCFFCLRPASCCWTCPECLVIIINVLHVCRTHGTPPFPSSREHPRSGDALELWDFHGLLHF